MANAVASIADSVLRKAKDMVGEVRRDIDAIKRVHYEEISEIKIAYERERATTAELRAKLNEHEFILERLRIDKKGPPGARGERGRDGPPGRGGKGERGEPAPRLKSWRIDSASYTATPVFEDSSTGPVLDFSAFVGGEDEED
jgi:hypothetical protein